MPEQPWIDFKVLRSQLDFRQVLAHYGVELRRKSAAQQQAFCPLPGHNGQRKTPSLSVNLDRRIWKCFSCHRGGNALDFCVYMEGKNPADRGDLRAVAILVADQFGIQAGSPDRPPRKEQRGDSRPRAPAPPPSRQPQRQVDSKPPDTAAQGSSRLPVVVNAPLDFELKDLDPDHPYLRDRGFTPETVRHFGLGFCNRGLMKGRVVIPLRDPAGRLIGYAGRFTRDDQVSDRVPKYLFPGDRERDGKVLAFRKSLLLYNRHAIEAPVRDLYVVEGFASVWHLYQAGFADVVALMGSDCSDEQVRLVCGLTSASGRVWLMPDAGEAGERCAHQCLRLIAPHRFCRWVRLDEGQPTDRTPAELAKLLEWRVTP